MDVKFRDSAEAEELRRRIDGERNAVQRDRYRAALLACEGRQANQIVEQLDRARRFVQRWAYAYRDGGIAALYPKKNKGRAPTLPREKEQAFKQRFTAGPTPTDCGVCTLRGNDAVRILKQEFGVEYSLRGVYDLLDRLNLSCLRPRPRHRKNDPAAMAAWLETSPLFVRNVCAQHPDKQVEVWFQDEARIGQQGTLTNVWAERGSRPTAVKQTEYDWVYLFGAVNPTNGDSSALITPTVNTHFMNEHLRFISERAGESKHVVLVLDQAGWHVAKALKVPTNITLLYLPPYSPELSAMERVWGYLRSHHLSNRVYRDYDDLFDVTRDAWNSIAEERFRTLCHEEWVERAA